VKKAEYKNHLWCWDFTMDETTDGRRLKWFSVVDEFTRECLALEVERRMKAKDAVAILTWLEAQHGAHEKHQNTDPFKFIIYSGKLREQTPQMASRK
jgi:putative transposase